MPTAKVQVKPHSEFSASAGVQRRDNANGNVTRTRCLKRDGYGRATFELLRAQILFSI